MDKKNILIYAEKALIECDGDKFKAIKILELDYGIDLNDAINYINDAYSKIQGNHTENTDCNMKINLSPVTNDALIFLKNGDDKITAIKKLKEKYNIGLVEAKANCDNAEHLLNNESFSLQKTISKTYIINSDTRKNAKSAILRGGAGALLIGPIGLLAATSAKNDTVTTFKIIFNDGSQDIVTVKKDSNDYKKYCTFL